MVSLVERAQLILERCPGDETRGDCIAYIDQCIDAEDGGPVPFAFIPARGEAASVNEAMKRCADAAPGLAKKFGPPAAYESALAAGGERRPKDLELLHAILRDAVFNSENPPESVQEQALSLVLFYGSWFPEAVRQQFDLAHQALEREGREAGPLLMLLERISAPDAERFVDWISRRQGGWNATVGRKIVLENNIKVAVRWNEGLSVQQRETVEALFSRADELLRAREYRFDGEADFLSGIQLQLSVSSLAGSKGEVQRPEEVLTDAFFARDAREVIKAISGEYGFDSQTLPPALAGRVWRFFIDAYTALCTSTVYWNAMESFLRENTQFIGEFLDRREAWFAGVPRESDVESKSVGHDYVYAIFRSLLILNLVPKEKRRESYLALMRYDGEGFDIDTYEEVEDVDAMERGMVRDFLTLAAGDAGGHVPRLLGDVCGRLLVKFAKEWGSRRMIAFMRENLPQDLVSKLKVSFELIGFMVDQEPAVVASLLSRYQDSSNIPLHDVEQDPLWKTVWNEFDGDVLSGIFENASDEVRYGRAIGHVPDMLIGYGKRDILERFYFDHHPYAPLFRLPADLRPTGKGLSFVSIDSFYDPGVKRHSDKADVKVMGLEKLRWNDADAPSHGVGTSSLAVGETMGLAPEAALYVAPVDDSITQNFPLTILDALRKLIELKKQDPSVTVAGISLALAVRSLFRGDAASSPIFRQLVECCEELHRMGVAIVVSAGNNGKKDHINLLGLLPHVVLVGAQDSRKTEERGDDAVSAYSTGGDAVNRPDLAAHADPVLFSYNGDKARWLEQGGTSFAQPHFSGTLLLMTSVNPALSMDECLMILRQTADALKGGADIRGIDPMEALVVAAHLPGSTYEGERLARFSKELGYDSDTFMRSKVLRKFPGRHWN